MLKSEVTELQVLTSKGVAPGTQRTGPAVPAEQHQQVLDKLAEAEEKVL